MSKFVKKLKLTNKTMNVYRIIDGAYQLHISNIPMRFEGLEPVDTALRISDNIREKVMLITSNLICDPLDIEITDRIDVVEDGISFVCSAVRKYDEANLAYFEILMRQVDSPYHEPVKIYKLTEAQPNYDPIFKQWENVKGTTYTEVNCLITTEPLRKRGEYSDTERAGQMVENNLLLIVDLPLIIDTTDHIEARGERFHVRRVERLEYQTEVLLEKMLPSGREFTV